MNNDYREGFESAQREIASDGWTVETARQYLATVKPLDEGNRYKAYDDGHRAALVAFAKGGSK